MIPFDAIAHCMLIFPNDHNTAAFSHMRLPVLHHHRANQTRYWLANGASTCWESWTTMIVHGDDHFHGSRNHAWLCGGVGEWLYSALAGVPPSNISSPGFRRLRVAPKVSATLGPASVNATVKTARGPVVVSWMRGSGGSRSTSGGGGDAASISGKRIDDEYRLDIGRESNGVTSPISTNGHSNGAAASVALDLRVQIPFSSVAALELPLLVADALTVAVSEEGCESPLWNGTHFAACAGISAMAMRQVCVCVCVCVCVRLCVCAFVYFFFAHSRGLHECPITRTSFT